MAVDKRIVTNVNIGAYWRKYRKSAYTLTIIMQIALMIILGFSLILSGMEPKSIEFIVIIFAALSVSIIGNVILVREIIFPYYSLLSAMTRLSDEKTNMLPPNPNASAYERSGLKPVIQLLYGLETQKSNVSKKESSTDVNMMSSYFRNPLIGVVALDKNRQIIFKNDAAPLINDGQDLDSLQVIFESNDSINNWLEKAEQTINSEYSWRARPNRPLGEDGRKIYDIYASYQKDSQIETVIYFIDKSDAYLPEDENLNFLAIAAHELRGPITVIRGYLDVFGEEATDKLTDEEKVLLDRLVVSANRLSTYVNNLLGTARYDRRHLKTTLVESKLSDIYNTIADDMNLRASSQGRLLSVDIANDLPTVAADQSAISEVMANLIDNAIKYSHEGGAIEVKAEAAANDFIEVKITDHGIGMPSNVVGNLFSKFYRSHRSREAVYGTGIGLYLSKALVESHGGYIGVKSVENKGSVFTFGLPTYASVADKIKSSDNSNENLIKTNHGWIKNHSMYKG